MVQKILDGEAQGTPETKPHPSSGVGVRNVRDRLALIYGDKMRFEIDSTVGQGTKVRITVPLIYSEEELTLEPKAGERRPKNHRITAPTVQWQDLFFGKHVPITISSDRSTGQPARCLSVLSARV